MYLIRKEAIANVRLFLGTGSIFVNNRLGHEYFQFNPNWGYKYIFSYFIRTLIILYFYLQISL